MYRKLIQSGNLVELYEYQREPSQLGVPRASTARDRDFEQWRKTAFKRPPGEKRRDNLHRAKQSFRRLVQANLSKGNPWLLTLTMLDVVPYTDAMRCYTSFGQQLRRVFGTDVAWIAVAEFQKRGAVHYHALVWGLPYDVADLERSTRRIQNIWGYGYVDIVATDGSPKLATYLTKYLFKALQDDRLRGKRAYFASRNLMRPVSLNTPTAVDVACEATGISTGEATCVMEHTYGTEWLGRADYKAYYMNIL